MKLKMSLMAAAAGSALGLFLVGSASAGTVFSAPAYTNTFTVTGDSQNSTSMGVAYSGGVYYSANGGSGGSPIAQSDASGALISATSPTPGIDFRSIFTDASGDVFARGFSNSNIYEQTSFGQFTPVATLQGPVDSQEAVVLNSTGTGYVGNNNGVLQFWDLTGASTGSVTLQDFDANYPQGRSLSIFGNYALNYTGGFLSAYDLGTGVKVDQTALIGAQNSFNSNFGQSYANGYFFVANEDGDQYQGFQIGNASAAVPEPASWALMILGVGCVGAATRASRRKQGAALATA